MGTQPIRGTQQAGKPVYICLKATQHETHTSCELKRERRDVLDAAGHTHHIHCEWMWRRNRTQSKCIHEVSYSSGCAKAAAYPRKPQPSPICPSNQQEPAGQSALHTEIWTSQTERSLIFTTTWLDWSGQQNSRVSVTNVILIERRKNKKSNRRTITRNKWK